MADIDKVLTGLETCIPFKYETSKEKECRHDLCPYGGKDYRQTNGCIWDLMEDALKLLGKHKPKQVKSLSSNGTKIGRCPNCDLMLNKKTYPRSCGYCGQMVKWND